MKKEDIFQNLNLSLEGDNRQEKVPFITISNSKSNSSKNQNSKTSSNNKHSLTDNNSGSNSKNTLNNSSLNLEKKRIFRKKEKQLKSSNNNSYSENSLVKPVFDTSFYNHLNKSSQSISISEDKKEVKTESKLDRNSENETPKKKKKNNKYKAILSNNKTKNKAGKMVNFQGKNLMNYFKFMTVDVDNEEKNKNRVSSAENIPNKNIQLKKNVITINKSWNKKDMKVKSHPIKIVKTYKKSHSINKNQIQKIDIKKEKRSGSNIKISSSKRVQNNLGFEKLLNKYINRPKNIGIVNFPINILNNYMKCNNIINVEKKVNVEKIKATPKSDSYKRRLSASLFLKKRDSVNKNNLFNDYKPKPNEDININPIINPNKNINEQNQPKSNSIFDKILYNKVFFKIKPKKKEVENKNNINTKIINNYNDPNSYFLKFKDNKELLKQDKFRVNKGFNYINKK